MRLDCCGNRAHLIRRVSRLRRGSRSCCTCCRTTWRVSPLCSYDCSPNFSNCMPNAAMMVQCCHGAVVQEQLMWFSTDQGRCGEITGKSFDLLTLDHIARKRPCCLHTVLSFSHTLPNACVPVNICRSKSSNVLYQLRMRSQQSWSARVRKCPYCPETTLVFKRTIQHQSSSAYTLTRPYIYAVMCLAIDITLRTSSHKDGAKATEQMKQCEVTWGSSGATAGPTCAILQTFRYSPLNSHSVVHAMASSGASRTSH